MNAAISITAALPESGNYFGLLKWLVLAVGLAGWLAACQWVDKDAFRLHYKRHMYNSIALGAGVVGAASWLLVPYFLVGLLLFAVLAGGGLLTYVYMRNQLVPPESRVLTAEHFSRLFSRSQPQSIQPAGEVQLTSISGALVAVPPPSDMLHDGHLASQALLVEAIGRRAERVVLASTAQGVAVQFTIDGMPAETPPLDRHTADLIIACLKQYAGMDTEDRRRPQTGRLIANWPPQPVDPAVLALGYKAPETLPGRTLAMQLHTSGTRAGENLAIELTDQRHALSLDQLGLSERQLELLSGFRRVRGGIVIFGSASKAGSTTTFYQALRGHDVFMSNIQTIEEQPGADLENITQHAFDAASAEASFARQLQSIVRRGPDIVGVSQCKDKETAQFIAGSSEELKFYVEMSGRDTFTLLARWAALVGDLKLASKQLHMVFAQTLLRKLCPACREAYRPDPQLLRKVNLPADRIDRLFRPPASMPTDKHGVAVPCPLCRGVGYLGRTGVFEILVVDDELRQLIVRNASANEIKKYCRTQKMLYLQEEALKKVIAGETSINEIVRVFANNK